MGTRAIARELGISHRSVGRYVREIARPRPAREFREFAGQRYYRTEKGYWRTDTKLGRGYLHRDIWIATNGPIPDGSHVHHIDHDKDNNELSNLTLLNEHEHQVYHRAERAA